MIPGAGATVPTTTGAGAAAAAAAKRRRDDEEENMTGYDKNDLEGWEFKIVRSNFGRFRKLEVVQEVCKREAEAGWEMLEKFDDQRIRFKRRIENRKRDAQLGYDPYRTSGGLGEGRTVAVIIAAIAAVALIGILAATLARQR